MMLTVDKMVPLVPACAMTQAPGLRPAAIHAVNSSFLAILTPHMRSLLRENCGFISGESGTVDFTGRWHSMEPPGVFRPCLTLAIDDDGRGVDGPPGPDCGEPHNATLRDSALVFCIRWHVRSLEIDGVCPICPHT
jgi:hypothetical protein